MTGVQTCALPISIEIVVSEDIVYRIKTVNQQDYALLALKDAVFVLTKMMNVETTRIARILLIMKLTVAVGMIDGFAMTQVLIIDFG